FKDYINQFRIDKARQALLDPQNALLTIEAIGQQCGFQSKSTFFRAFKKETQLTPKQYVDQKRSSN
ncbi:MAG: helix-turn-helix domain-containing protein, partial [Bacteroidota bacterium]